jgi:hypothetical protein
LLISKGLIMAQNGPGRMSAMSPLCAQKRTSLEGRMFSPVPPAERRLSAQPSTPFEQTAARATGPAATARSPERRPLDIVQAGLRRHRDRRDPAHPGARHHGNADHVVKRRAHPRDRSLDAASNRAGDAAGPGDGDPVRSADAVTLPSVPQRFTVADLKKRPQRGVMALRPLQFRRPIGDLGGGVGPSGPPLSIWNNPKRGQYNSPARERFRQQCTIFQLRMWPKESAPVRGGCARWGLWAEMDANRVMDQI